MAAKKSAKKTLKKVAKRAQAAAAPKLTAAKKSAKKTAKSAVAQAQGLLGKLAQKSAQLILDSGLLGEAPDDATPTKKKRRAKR
jgi:hypothetical protein